MLLYDKVNNQKENDNSFDSIQHKHLPLTKDYESSALTKSVSIFPHRSMPINTMVLQHTIDNQSINTLTREKHSFQVSKESSVKENNTRLPNNLKTSIESLSGLSLDDVKVHYNSDKPAQVGALAYTQGNDIHVASGKEEYLPHEVWHVVQQAQGRVRPTTQVRGMSVNDDTGLEAEADVMGGRAVTQLSSPSRRFPSSCYLNHVALSIYDSAAVRPIIQMGGQDLGYRKKLSDELFYKYNITAPQEIDIVEAKGISAEEIVSYIQTGITLKEIIDISKVPGINNIEDFRKHIESFSSIPRMAEIWQNLNKNWETAKSKLTTLSHTTFTGIVSACDNLLCQAQELVFYEEDFNNPALPSAYKKTKFAALDSEINLYIIGSDNLVKAYDYFMAAKQQALSNLEKSAKLDEKIKRFLSFQKTNPNKGYFSPATQASIQSGTLQCRKDNIQSLLHQLETKMAEISKLTSITVSESEDYLHISQEYKNTSEQPTHKVDDVGVSFNSNPKIGGFNDSEKYPNLSLTFAETEHPFWKKLTPQHKECLNNKLVGYKVTSWREEGYPKTRAKFTNSILIPTLEGFPVEISGEIVNDWTFNYEHHGHPAKKMCERIKMALNGEKIIIPRFAECLPMVNGDEYTWKNITTKLIIRNQTLLVTYFDESY